MSSFKQLLLRKIAHDDLLIKVVEESSPILIKSIIFEILHKAEKPKNYVQKPAHHDFIKNFHSAADGEMLYDALSHHASHYKDALTQRDALKASNVPSDAIKAQNQQNRANKHAAQFFNTMNLARHTAHGIADNTDGSKLSIDAPSPNPWIRNHSNKDEQGKYISAAKGWAHNQPDKFSFLRIAPKGGKAPDHSFLEKAPTDHDDLGGHDHRQAYPIEHVKINGKYLDIKPIDQQAPDTSYDQKHENGAATPHIFDSHPIFNPKYHASHQSEQNQAEYRDAAIAFKTAPETKQFFRNHINYTSADEHKNRRAEREHTPSDPVHQSVSPTVSKYDVPKEQTVSPDDEISKILAEYNQHFDGENK